MIGFFKEMILIVFLNLHHVNSFLPNFYGQRSVPNMKSLSNQKENLYFTGAGIYFWWQAGCAKYIQENYDISDIKVIGASAGSLTGSLLLNGCNFENALKTAFEIADEYKLYDRKTGLNGILGPMLKDWIEEVLPEKLDPSTFDNLEIALTPVQYLLPQTPKLVSCFKDRSELIECILASCHIPILLDGRPAAVYKNDTVIDGSFWYFVTKDRWEGLPLPSGMRAPIYWVDYTDDDIFMRKISGNILELADPSLVHMMMEDGYNHMLRQDLMGNIPFQKKIGAYVRSTFIPDSVKLLTNKLKSKSFSM